MTDAFNPTVADILEELTIIADECSKHDWDGYDAAPVERETYYNACKFIKALPEDLTLPGISVSPGGEISFEWYQSRLNTLSVYVSSKNKLQYAGLLKSKRVYGTTEFTGMLPQIILQLVRKVQKII